MNHSKNYMLLLRKPAVVSGCTEHVQHVVTCSICLLLLFLCMCMFCGAWHRDIRLWAYAHAVVTFLILMIVAIYLFWFYFCYFTYFEAGFHYIALDVLEVAT